MKKKIVGILAAAVIGTTAFATVASAASGTINVISREDGSGTRGAFIELFGIQEEKDGEKVDMTTEDASITNSTSVMMTTVAGDENAIGYISLGSLNDTVKAVKIDGAEATAENVADESYKVSRPFNIVTGEKASEAAQDFVSYIMSADGQQIIEALDKYGVFGWESGTGEEEITDPQHMVLAVLYDDGTVFRVEASGLLSQALPDEYDEVKEMLLSGEYSGS